MTNQETPKLNKDDFVIAKAKISDKFDLPLQEDAEDTGYYNTAEIKHEVDQRITKLSTLGAYYTIQPDAIAEYEIIDSKDAIASIEPIGAHKYLFRISRPAARKRNEKYLDTIIYHELCHILQIECLVNIGIMDFLDDELGYVISQKALVEAWFYKDDYHTDIWYTFVNKINSVFNVIPPVDRFLDENTIVDLFLESTFKSDTFVPANAVIIDKFKIK